jgi:fatty-acyl-CoA synthase
VVLVPSVIRLLLGSGALDRLDLTSLRISMTGAEPITMDVLDELSEKIPNCANLQGYEQSEFPTFLSVLHADEARAKVGSAGKATSLCEMRVVDEHGVDTATGAEGEIVYRSAATMSGYWRQPELTANAMNGGWMHSGDRGFVDEDGYLFITGRSKDLIIGGGLNVYPAEVERVILEHGPVQEAAVIGVPHPKLGEVGLAILVAKEGETVDVDALQTAVTCAGNLQNASRMGDPQQAAAAAGLLAEAAELERRAIELRTQANDLFRAATSGPRAVSRRR